MVDGTVTLEGAWDCPYCNKTNKGRKKHCGGCGAPRGDDVRFYLPKDAEVVEPGWNSVGPDWTCSFCSGDNRGDDNFCENCGNSREPDDKTREVIHYGSSSGIPTTAKEAEAQDRERKERKTRSYLRRPFSPNTTLVRARDPNPSNYHREHYPVEYGISLVKRAGLVMVGLLLIWMIWFFFISTEEITLKTATFSWDREIKIERYVWVDEDAWDSAPAGARNVSSRREVHHYDKVLDHYETKYRTVQEACGTESYDCGATNNGDGTFTTKTCSRTKYCSRQESYEEPVYRDEPVYAQKYYYEIQRWRTKRSVQSSGEDNVKTPYWPDTKIGEGQYASFQEREGKKSQEYKVFFTYTLDEETGTHSESLSQSEWAKINRGEEFIADINRAGLIRNRRKPGPE